MEQFGSTDRRTCCRTTFCTTSEPENHTVDTRSPTAAEGPAPVSSPRPAAGRVAEALLRRRSFDFALVNTMTDLC
ncbi:hypothetical protein MHYP_G00027870 [Metynnis hypsauchen]